VFHRRKEEAPRFSAAKMPRQAGRMPALPKAQLEIKPLPTFLFS